MLLSPFYFLHILDVINSTRQGEIAVILLPSNSINKNLKTYSFGNPSLPPLILDYLVIPFLSFRLNTEIQQEAN